MCPCADRIHFIQEAVVCQEGGGEIGNALFGINELSAQSLRDPPCIRSDHDAVVSESVKYYDLRFGHLHRIMPVIPDGDAGEDGFCAIHEWNTGNAVDILSCGNGFFSLDRRHLVYVFLYYTP